MKYTTTLLIGLLALLVACAPAQKACSMEAKLCPDGSAVGRTGPNCEFAACPEGVAAQQFRDYKGNDADTCSRIRFTCDGDEMFSDETGCGCLRDEPVETSSPGHPQGGLAVRQFMLCSKSSFGNESFFEEQGFSCVDECPQGYDEFAAQIGLMCVTHYGEAEISSWPTCAKSTDCNIGAEQTCGKATTTTDNQEVANPQFRCVPQGYENFMINRGFELKDENGQSSTVIS